MSFILYDPNDLLVHIKPRQAEAFRLRFMKGLTYREIAGIIKSFALDVNGVPAQSSISKSMAGILVQQALYHLRRVRATVSVVSGGRYRHYPTGAFVKAFQWLKHGDLRFVSRWATHHMKGQGRCEACALYMHFHGWITTVEGGCVVCPGTVFVFSVEGEYYPYKPDRFKEHYTLVGNGVPQESEV